MAIPYCTITAGGGIKDLLGITETALQYAKVTFTPNIKPGHVFTFDDTLYRPRPVTVTLNVDGQFTVDVLGNDPMLDLETPLEYTVSFSEVKVKGFNTQIVSWSFIAPNAGETVGLDQIPRVVGSTALGSTRGPRGYRSRIMPITDGPNAGKYQWVDEHGTAFNDPVEREVVIPATIARDAADEVVPDAFTDYVGVQELTWEDAGEGMGYPKIGGVVAGSARPWPAATWSGVAGKPIRTVAEFGAIGDGVADDTSAINAGLTWMANNGGGLLYLGWNHLVTGTLVVPECTILRGHGGHSGTRGTRITSSATSGAVVHLSARSARLEHVRLLATTGRRAAATTTGHGVFIGGTDVVQASYPFFTRVGLFDVDIRDQPTDGVHGIGTMEMGNFNVVTVTDCVRHGFVLDGGGIAGWTNAQLGPFMMTLTACRAIECGGQALICLSTGGLAPQGLQLDFEALGCAWDSTKRNTISGVADTALHQIQIGGRGHIFHRLDIEDQQYAATTTTSQGRTRTALSNPSKGVYNLSNGVVVNLPFFSSLVQSWTQAGNTAGVNIKYPTVFPGTYGTTQNPAFLFPSSATNINIEYSDNMCTGASRVVQNQSLNAKITANGVPLKGLGSSTVLGWSEGLTPTTATISAGTLTTTSTHTTVAGEGAASDDLSTIRIVAGNNGYAGLVVWLFRGSEDITIKHGTGNILNQSGADVVMTSTSNVLVGYKYNGSNWVQISGPSSANAQNLTATRVSPRVGGTTSSPNPVINTDLYDQFNLTAQAQNIASMTTNLSGTPSDGQRLRIRFKDNGTGRTIAWGSSFVGNLLATTVATKTHIQDLLYDAAAGKWVGTYADTAGY